METIAFKDNKTFSIDRFVTLMKADLAVNKSNYLKLIIGGTGVFVALALLISVIAIIDINSLKQVTASFPDVFQHKLSIKQQSYGAAYSSISVWIFSIGLTVLGSMTFSNLSSKKKRITALMIPASQIEKFALRLLTYLVAGSIALIIGLLVGLCICQIAFGGGWLAFEELDTFFGQEYSGTVITAFILIALLGNSIYALGSSLWPKLSWIKTWVVLMVIEWIGTIALFTLSSADISWHSFFMFWSGHLSFLKWSSLSVLAILNIACWVLAWIRYHNTQIVQRFMTK